MHRPSAESNPFLRRREWLQWLGLLWASAPQAQTQETRLMPLWLDPQGQPTPWALEALQLLQNASNEGLMPADYPVDPLPTTDPAAWSTQLNLALQHYAHDLHRGRVNPRSLGLHSALPLPPFDAQAWLPTTLQTGDLQRAAAGLAPNLAPYAALRNALARYRLLASQVPATAWPSAPRKLMPGDPWDGLPQLRQYLAALGDAPADTQAPADPKRYDLVLRDAVQAFQQRHGLDADGAIGPATQAAFRVPLAQRVRQIEWSMERLRWLPPLSADRGLAINIPGFRLRAWEGPPTHPRPGPGMAVIVGQSLDTQTPLMLGELRYLIFRPYWNVPRSILLKEILPKWAHQPNYLARQDLEIVQGPGDDARVLGTGMEHLPGLRNGSLRLRQRPGPHNSLGAVKFVFPNDAAIYLHGTPVPQLFQRARRDFSHGCVRVEDPVTLAVWLLNDQPGWDRAHVEAAMRDSHNLRVDLLQPVPVLLYYLTAVVDPEDGRLHFADDLYGHDARLASALQRRSAVHQ